jgi:hypothetical protein
MPWYFHKQELLEQISSTAVKDCTSKKNVYNLKCQDIGFRVRIQGKDLGYGFRVEI